MPPRNQPQPTLLALQFTPIIPLLLLLPLLPTHTVFTFFFFTYSLSLEILDSSQSKPFNLRYITTNTGRKRPLPLLFPFAKKYVFIIRW